VSGIIPIRPCGTINGYATANEAIRAAANHPRQPKAREDSAALEGRCFVGAACDHRHWLVEFTGALWLDVSAGPAGVDWAVTPQPVPLRPVAGPTSFEWPGGPVSTVDCQALSEPRRGAEFWRLQVNDGGLLLYLRSLPILNFHAVERRDTGEVLLFACDGD